MTINDVPLTVIGIASSGFTGIQLESPVDVFAPLMMRPRLRPGGPPSFYEKRLLLEPAGGGISLLRREMSGTLKLLMAVAGLLLVAACANLAGLLLGRSAARRKEIGVRLALGASRPRLVVQLLTEGLLLVLPGALAGLLVASGLYDLLLAFQPGLDVAETTLGESLDGRVLTFALLVSVLSGVLFGLAPALQSARTDLVPALKDAVPGLGRSAPRLHGRHLLVVAQVALTMMMLVGGGLFIRTLRNLLAIDPGFRPENVLRVALDLPRQNYNAETSNRFYRDLTERLTALPGVEAVSFAGRTPLDGSRSSMSIAIEGHHARADENIGIAFNQVGPGYHHLLRIPIVQGRGFTEGDRVGARGVVIVNEALARLYFPNQNPLGRRLGRGPANPWLEIVGVARNTMLGELTEAPAPQIDLPALQVPIGNYAKLLIRATGEGAGLVSAVRAEVRRLDPDVSISEVSTLSEELLDSIAPARMAATLTNLFGLTALLLAAVGLYGVIAFAVTQRTHEIGVRRTLGAPDSNVLWLVVRQGMQLAGIGIAIGLAGAFALTRALRHLLFGVTPTDPVTFAAIALVLAAAAALACWLPARRATQVDPVIALRSE